MILFGHHRRHKLACGACSFFNVVVLLSFCFIHFAQSRMSVARFTLLSYVCVYFVLNELFLWLDETPLRSRGIFGATSWHVVHVFHSMLLFFFHFASVTLRRVVGVRCEVCFIVLYVRLFLGWFRTD